MKRAFPFLLTSLLPALAAGAATILAFAPFGWWPLQIVTLALLFHLVLRQAGVRPGMLVGWAFGFGWSVCGIYWLFISMHDYGGMPAWMAALAVALLSAFLAGLPALGMGGAIWLRQRWQVRPAVMLLLVLPAAWALAEWSRGWVFTGFPWVVSGYAHSISPLGGFLPLVGVYGVSLLAALMAACLACAAACLRNNDKRIGFAALAVAALLAGAGVLLKTVAWTSNNGNPVTVRLLQGNVPQEMKFERSQILATLQQYHAMITAAPADLIATPETALPLFAHQLPPDYLPLVADFASRSGSFVAIGVPVSDSALHYANSVIGIRPAAATTDKSPVYYRYDKHHLVPFGEFIPTGFRWFVDMMHIPLGDFTRGPALQAPFAVKDQWVLPNICYEDLFGEEIADQLAALHYAGVPQASILLNMSNIAWFGDSLALPQHLQISQVRALETGRPMLRATNTGATAVINAKGEIVAQLKPYARGTLAASVQGMRGNTPYILYGNTIMLGLALLMLVSARFLTRRNIKAPDGMPEAHKTR